MENLLSIQTWLVAGLIFFLRMSDMTLDTLRTLFVMRGRKSISWVMGFFQSLIFVVALGFVLQDIDSPLSFVAYAAGFASGNVVGMLIEERLAIGHTHMRIVSSRWGQAIAEHLRAEGFAATEIPAMGKDGAVTLINCSVLRRYVDRVAGITREVDDQAFITAEDVRPLRRGFWRA